MIAGEHLHRVEIELLRVEMLLFLAGAEVKVGSRRATGRADVPDELESSHLHADLEPFGEAREMRVPGFDTTGVRDLHEISRRPRVTDEAYRARRRSSDRRARGRSEIRTEVRHHFLQDRMHPLEVEPRRDRRTGN